jgi:hypothetical protein
VIEAYGSADRGVPTSLPGLEKRNSTTICDHSKTTSVVRFVSGGLVEITWGMNRADAMVQARQSHRDRPRSQTTVRVSDSSCESIGTVTCA